VLGIFLDIFLGYNLYCRAGTIIQMNLFAGFFRVLLYFVGFNQLTHARVINGTIKTGSSWKFLTRFVFQPTTDSTLSSFEYSFEYHRKNKLVLLAYFDEDFKSCTKYTACPKWEDVYSKDNSCQFKDWAARTKGNAFDIWANYNMIKPTDSKYWWNVTQVTQSMLDNALYRQATGKLTFKSSRNRWYYFAIANCRPGTKDVVKDNVNHKFQSSSPAPAPEDVDLDETGVVMCKGDEFCQGPIDIAYKITLRNNVNNTFQDHFSADEFGILESTMVFSVLYAVLAVVASVSVHSLRRKRQLHHTVKIFYFSICIESVSQFIKLAYWDNVKEGTDPHSNVHMINTRRAFESFDLISNFAMMLVVLLLSKGWTVVRRKISAMGRVRFSIYMSMYMFIAITAMISQWNVDPGLVEYKFHSTAGELYVASRVLGATWFSYATFTTIKAYPSKRSFYRCFYAGYLAWILTVPILASIANGAIMIWHREKVVIICETAFNFLGHVILLALLWPSRYNKQFPFHAKTFHMDANGHPVSTPSKKGTQVLFNKRPGRTSSSGRNRTHLTGGDGFADPMDRAKELANTMRYKLMQIQDYSDDLVETLNTYESIEDEEGADLVAGSIGNDEQGFHEIEGQNFADDERFPPVTPSTFTGQDTFKKKESI
jgi:hypothetical protein